MRCWALEAVDYLQNVHFISDGYIFFFLFVLLILLGAARALLAHTDMSAEEIGLKAMKIAADKCIYTNHNFVSEKITW